MMTAPPRSVMLEKLRAGHGGPDLMVELQGAIDQGISRTAEDMELLLGFAQLAWIADQRDPQATRARDAAQMAASLVPTLQDGYRLLGLAHLSRGEYREAYMAFTAAGRIEGAVNLDNFKALAQNLMLGTPQATFEVGQHRYVFDLSCHNAAAIEAGAFHSVGVLTEAPELQAIEIAGVGRKIKSIAEIGVLMGNHTAFFLKAFAPQQLILVDADPANLPFIANTVRNNSSSAVQLEVVNAFVGGGGGQTMFAGARVPHRAINDIISTPIDLLKIDVDGAEVSLLSGAGDVIERSRPLVMIETTPTTHTTVMDWFAKRGYTSTNTFDHGGYTNTILRPGA